MLTILIFETIIKSHLPSVIIFMTFEKWLELLMPMKALFVDTEFNGF